MQIFKKKKKNLHHAVYTYRYVQCDRQTCRVFETTIIPGEFEDAGELVMPNGVRYTR